MAKYKVLLWGCGKNLFHILDHIKRLEDQDEIQIVGVTAKELPEGDYLEGYNLISHKCILDTAFDYILVTTSKYFDEIKTEISSEYGIDKKRFINCRYLSVPCFDIKKYADLQENPVTIISNNCWGGLVYNYLGLQCVSPFKNLFLLDDDYLNLLSNFNYYISQELIFDRYETEPHSGARYPVMKLDDIEVHCNHALNSDDAISDWNRRKALMNFDNVFAEMYTMDENVARRFQSVMDSKKGIFKSGICLTPFQVDDCSSVMSLDFDGNLSDFWQKVLDSAHDGSVNWLNIICESMR